MAIQSILIHTNDDAHNNATIASAIALARHHEATITALCVWPYPVVILVTPIGDAMPVIDSIIEAYQQACEAAKDWRDDDGDTADRGGFHARCADIAVLGQVSPEGSDGQTSKDLTAIVAMNSSQPTLAIPYFGKHGTLFKHVMLCWNATREASRALHDFLMILQPGAPIYVLCVDTEDSAGRVPSADIAAHLTWHSFEAVAYQMANPELRTSDTILSASADLEAELIVMGKYGHARLREIALDEVT